MIIYAGPSLSAESRALIAKIPEIQLRPPVKRGDVEALISDGYTGLIAIVDGVFHQSLSVSHEELLDAIGAGMKVHGISSMGAIRAYELRDCGMSGFGRVYSRFLQSEDFQDDEVALLHGPAPDYLPLSEPLVHFRAFIEECVALSRIDLYTADVILRSLKERYFGERTFPLFAYILKNYAQNLEFNRSSFEQYREKQHDLIDFVKSYRIGHV